MSAIYDPKSPSVNDPTSRDALRAALLEARTFIKALADSLGAQPPERVQETDQVLANFAEDAIDKAFTLFEASPE